MSRDRTGQSRPWAGSRVRRTLGHGTCLAGLGMGVVFLAGCSAQDDFPEACVDVRSQEETLRLEITGKEWSSDQDRVATERQWAEVVFGQPDCFTAERVAIAGSILRPP